MMIGKPHRTTPSACATRCILTLLAMASLGLTALAQQATGAPAHAAATSAQAKAKPAAAAEETETPSPNNAAHQGIKVHGHWVLTVKNPDGKLVERREFDNSLVTGGKYVSGDQMLAAILTGDLTPGGFGVTLITGNTAGLDATALCPVAPASQTSPAGIGCYGLLDYKTLLYAWPYGNDYLYGLASSSGGQQIGLATSVTFAPQASIVLSGNFEVGCYESGNWANLTLNCGGTMPPITAVQTYIAGCGNATNVFGISESAEDSTFTQATNTRFTGTNQPGVQSGIAPTACTEANQQNPGSVAVIMGVLTSTGIPGGSLSVTTNQIITVTVTLSFS